MPQNRTYGTNGINGTEEEKESIGIIADTKKAEQKGTLIRKNTGIIHVLESNEVLATMSTLHNKKGKLKIKGTGLNFSSPFFQKKYYINNGTLTKPLKNDKQSDGKFSLNIGLGEDAIFDVVITYEAVKTNAGVTALVKQQDAYEANLHTYAVKILQYKLAKLMAEGRNFVTSDGTDEELLAQTIREIVSININDVMTKALTEPIDEYEKSIIDDALELQRKYGVKLNGVTVKDVDINKRMKEIKEKALIAEKEREIRAKDAENERNIQKAQAEMNAEIAKINAKAANEEMSERMKKLKRLGMSDEAIKDYIMKEYDLKAIEKLPANAVAIVNSGSGNNLMSEVVAAEEAARRKK